MQIHGLNKTTLLDYPEHVAATIFTGGCNFCCPFCHNGELVLQPQAYPQIPEEEIMALLKKRKGILSGVCITGGEPTLQKDLPAFIEKIKELGYLVKLDTNGYRPEVLHRLLEQGLLDYVAMDIKNAKTHYPQTVGLKTMDLTRIEESVQILIGGTIDYEFRTTVVRQLHTIDDFQDIAFWLDGARAYYLQVYKDNENVIQKGFSAYEKDEMESFLEVLAPHIEKVELRGIE
ncbi:MAG TPA: anaerobic ribonucleoside-triphosphate reductase activating protein [Lachnospiraceae bacterium]|nr:anaerobic ribonucleoside-triphosphate reductase activating protein [Lachnospiraceae bacterium]